MKNRSLKGYVAVKRERGRRDTFAISDGVRSWKLEMDDRKKMRCHMLNNGDEVEVHVLSAYPKSAF